MIGVLTESDRMPEGFPGRVQQNAGNMVHASAPFRMFPNAVGPRFGWRQEGYRTFVDFVNERCTHLVVPYANVFRSGQETGAGRAHMALLPKIKVPIVPFGIGAQAQTTDLELFEATDSVIGFMRFLCDTCPAISVRGDFTYSLFEKFADVSNVYNTGCPSFFSRPEAFKGLADRLSGHGQYATAFSGALHHTQWGKHFLRDALESGYLIVEAFGGELHRYYTQLMRGNEADVPYYLVRWVNERENYGTVELGDLIARNYRLFRDMPSWFEFNEEIVGFTYGTRFHVNMASLLSGAPALWISHDARIEELCRRLSLPTVSVETAMSVGPASLSDILDMGPMLENVSENFRYFNGFLSAAGLPDIPVPTIL